MEISPENRDGDGENGDVSANSVKAAPYSASSSSSSSCGASSSSPRGGSRVSVEAMYEDEEEEEEDVCRICRNPGEPDNPLRYPCACSGSIKFVHQDCLLQWLNHSNARQCEVPLSLSLSYVERSIRECLIRVLGFLLLLSFNF
jgi:E3 ubiquitin-protein ligase MARCH6